MNNLIVAFRRNQIICRHLNRLCSVRDDLYLDHRKHFSRSELRFRTILEKDRRDSDIYTFPTDRPFMEHIQRGRKIFLQECKLWVKEMKEKFSQDPKLYVDGDTDVFFRFDNPECLTKWRIGSDKTNKHGNSDCTFTINDKGKGVFSGIIDITPPKDGKNRFAGYCGIKSVRKTKSFLRDDCFNWHPFTHLELRVKGDGRNYMVNLGLGMYFDVNWFDTYTYVMHTRGGPYWQVIRIPFSKFFLTSKGRTQDYQTPMPLIKVNSVGITCGMVSGPFHLEIDYIGCHVDDTHKEKTAYEMYKIPKAFVTD